MAVKNESGEESLCTITIPEAPEAVGGVSGERDYTGDISRKTEKFHVWTY